MSDSVEEFRISYFRNRLSSKAFEELGYATLVFSELEWSVDLGITLLLDEPANSVDYVLGGIVTAGMSFSGKQNLFGSLNRYRFEDQTDEDGLKALMKHLTNASKARNDLQHSQFVPESDDNEPDGLRRVRATWKSGFGLNVKFSPSDHESVAVNTKIISDAYWAWLDFWLAESERIGYEREDHDTPTES